MVCCDLILSLSVVLQLLPYYDVNGIRFVPDDQICIYDFTDTLGGLHRLDVHGRCLPVEIGPVNTISRPYPHLFEISDKQVDAYHYASGRLVPGCFREGVGFVPLTGGKIIDIYQYMNSKHFTIDHRIPRLFRRDYIPEGGREIYNLPGYFYDSKTAERMRNGKPSILLPFPRQPPCERIENEINTLKYVYKHTASDRQFVARLGKLLYTGTYCKNGFFSPVLESPYVDAAQHDKPRWAKPSKKNEAVYELCHGALIPGFLYKIPTGERLFSEIKRLGMSAEELTAKDDDYIFVPDLGGVIIDMPEYLKHYDPKKSRRIHNLSGEIKPVTK